MLHVRSCLPRTLSVLCVQTSVTDRVCVCVVQRDPARLKLCRPLDSQPSTPTTMGRIQLPFPTLVD